MFLLLSVKHMLIRGNSMVILKNTWNGYKHYFIESSGRVSRNKEEDTVSEAQAYAMLRSVWMNDKETFDRCYGWTEHNLSRKNKTGDNLLVWRWKDNEVVDWLPASDADIDYALSLIFADSIWNGKAPANVEDYGKKARVVLNDILRLETYPTSSGRLYLSAWILDNRIQLSRLPINPSYYSPAHFRIFYEYAKDARWLKLVDTSYYILSILSKEFNGEKGVGLIPDWCSVDMDDKFYPLDGKNSGFGWDAVRVPFRVALDFFLFDSDEAKGFFNSGFAKFIEQEWLQNKKVFCEYNYNGEPISKYENPLFYAAYYCALRINGSKLSQYFLKKTRDHIKKDGQNWIYQDRKEYYVNSLAWFAEGFNAGIIRLLKKEISL